MKLVYQNNTGLFHGQVSEVKITISQATAAVIESLRSAGATVTETSSGIEITTSKMPKGIVAIRGKKGVVIRLESEPEYPVEFRDDWSQVDFLPCPKCGHAVIWYEAGYVPGYRVCVGKKHHHSLAK